MLAPDDLNVLVEYGTQPGAYTHKTKDARLSSGEPIEILLEALQPDTRYYYRLNHRRRGESACNRGAECSFHTQRAPGSTFTFGVQGDSHPERLNRMCHPDLCVGAIPNVQADRPDFYITLGDDFNLEHLYNRNILNAGTVAQLYIHQRSFLGLAGRTVPRFLVNGNHEQAAKHLLDGTPSSVPVLAGKARNLYYPSRGYYSTPVECDPAAGSNPIPRPAPPPAPPCVQTPSIPETEGLRSFCAAAGRAVRPLKALRRRRCLGGAADAETAANGYTFSQSTPTFFRA